MAEFEYDLKLQWDVNTRGNTQWFYFSIENHQTNTPYIFRILNLTKPDSLYNQGMQPLIYSTKEFTKCQAGWKRYSFR